MTDERLLIDRARNGDDAAFRQLVERSKGTTYRLAYDLTRPAGEQLLEVEIDGALLDPARRYRLASTYFTLSDITDDPEYDFIGLQPGQVIEQFRVEDVLWEVVADWLRARGTG